MADEILAALADDGALARTVPGFAARPQQIELARAIAEAIDGGHDLIAEAGTGTGKTFAYLVPALLSGKRVVISTGTKALQDQLYFRDLPAVLKALSLRPKTALLKGRGNYLCLYRLERSAEEGRFASRADVAQFRKIRLFAARTRDGDRAECRDVPEDAPIWQYATSTADNCLGAGCPLVESCHLVRARRRALAADLLVINHHLLFADMAVKRDGFGEVLPGAQAFVIDEAHQLAEAAGGFFSTALSQRQLVDLGQDTLAEAGQVSGAAASVLKPVQALGQTLRKLRADLIGQPDKGATRALLDDPVLAEGFALLGERVAEMLAVTATLAESSEGLAHVGQRWQQVGSDLAMLLSGTDDGHVRWYELTRLGFTLQATPLDIATPFGEYRAKAGAAWILTSATLAVGDSFALTAAETGFLSARTLKVESPFDYRRQALLYLPPGLPEPSAPDYTERVVEAIRPVLEASRGRAFLLFTSHRALQRAAELLEGSVPWPLFVQGREPRSQLLAAFRAAGNGVLLGAASFWEGIDVKGEALSLVVIDKLPFAQIGDPVLEARLASLRRRGGNPFPDYQLPQAVLALKQGAGRLIRDPSDRGVLMLCDPRLIRKGYGRDFLDSLPAFRRTQELDEVRRFFAG